MQRANDTLTGLTYMGVRVYAPAVGLFVQVDPVLGGNATAYGYPFDPITELDVDGRTAGHIEGSGGGGSGGIGFEEYSAVTNETKALEQDPVDTYVFYGSRDQLWRMIRNWKSRAASRGFVNVGRTKHGDGYVWKRGGAEISTRETLANPTLRAAWPSDPGRHHTHTAHVPDGRRK